MIPGQGLSADTRRNLAKIDDRLALAQGWLCHVVRTERLAPNSSAAEAVLAIAHARGLLNGQPQARPVRAVVHFDDGELWQ